MTIEVSKTRDWSQYNAAAKKSGAITFYISEEAIAGWYNEDPTGERGASETYSDIAIRACSGDGAYDAEAVYQAAEDIGAILIVPPRRGARMQSPANAITAKASRDAAITYIHEHGTNEDARKAWKQETGYHARSLSETAMYRFKTHCGSHVRARTFKNQRTEIAIKVKILNKKATLGTFLLNRSAALAR
jgi:hypothetical protein